MHSDVKFRASLVVRSVDAKAMALLPITDSPPVYAAPGSAAARLAARKAEHTELAAQPVPLPDDSAEADKAPQVTAQKSQRDAHVLRVDNSPAQTATVAAAAETTAASASASGIYVVA